MIIRKLLRRAAFALVLLCPLSASGQGVPGLYSPLLRPSATGTTPVAAAVTRTFNASSSQSAALSSYTFNLSTGATGGTNNVIGVCTWRGGTDRTFSSATINGVAATLAVSTTSGTGTGIAIFGASTTTGAAVNFVVTISGASARAACASYTMFNAASLTPSATATDITSPISQSLAVPNNGVAFGGFMSTDTTTVTWGGLTEDVDAQVDAQVYSMASVNTTTPGATLTVSVTPGSGPSDPVFAAASYGP